MICQSNYFFIFYDYFYIALAQHDKYMLTCFALFAYKFPSSLLSDTPDSLSELETDIKVFKDSLLKILDEDEFIEELCLTKWTDPRVLYVSHPLPYT